MSADRDVTRIVRSWLHEDAYEDADRILNLVLDEIDTTPQRRASWLARRFPPMNTYLKVGLAAAVAVLAVILGISYFSGSNVGSPPDASPSPSAAASAASPPPFAAGSFGSHGGNIQLDVVGEGPSVTGSMTYADDGSAGAGGFVVDIACGRTTDGGLIAIGGLVTESTGDYADSVPVGHNAGIVLQPGSPVKAELIGEWGTEAHEPSCATFLESVPDLGDPARDPNGLEPITGSVELNP
jgi:hypothetical protein